MKISIKSLINDGQINKNYTIFGWVRTKRGNKQIVFLSLNDGSCFEDIQVVSELDIDLKEINTDLLLSIL